MVLTYGDIDQVGEKKQLSGLKDISNYTEQVTLTIKNLLSMGYKEVYLTADHGFVITGILDEADKIPTPNGDDKKMEERFIKSNTQLDTDLIEKQSDFCCLQM